MTSEQENLLRKVYAEQQLASTTIERKGQQMLRVKAYLDNYRVGLLVLEELHGKKDGEEMLMNVGGEIYVHAKLVDSKKVTRHIGKDISIEQNIAEAKKSIEEIISSLEKQYDGLAQEYQQLLGWSSNLGTQFQQLAAEMKKQGE
ncbi:MAG: prefoldin subunit alpha [Candidatus Thorarchaeota archaeon]|nr:prefoldin subunit alpha [Candidatus Thorarchaeota archaeon]